MKSCVDVPQLTDRAACPRHAVQIRTYLPVPSRRLRRRFGEKIQVPFAIRPFPAVACRTTAQPTQRAQPGQADETIIGRQLVVVLLRLRFPRRYLLGRVLVWSQDGGHVERSQSMAVVGLRRGWRCTVRSAQGRNLLRLVSLRRIGRGLRLRLRIRVRRLLIRVEMRLRLRLFMKPRHDELCRHPPSVQARMRSRVEMARVGRNKAGWYK